MRRRRRGPRARLIDDAAVPRRSTRSSGIVANSTTSPRTRWLAYLSFEQEGRHREAALRSGVNENPGIPGARVSAGGARHDEERQEVLSGRVDGVGVGVVAKARQPSSPGKRGGVGHEVDDPRLKA